ncbi:MAG: type II toxin-antitoxin system PemK/MazF family toxin [Candidatus Magasanikbacteria bacterium]|nr:type II toxin-antitoxin system PemK/MazF family toxin [Candidatus Magasanikbacteria bacterium]
MKQGEIWLVNYPEGAGHEYFKERPALVVESDEQIAKTKIFTVMAMTSNANNRVVDDILITMDKYNNLHSDSVLKTHHIQSFDISRFMKRIGKVKDEILVGVKQYLKIHFGL